MAGLPRVFQPVFASNLQPAPTGVLAVPGSTAGGGPSYSGDIRALMGLVAWLNGYQAQVVGTQSPVLEELNGILVSITQQLAYQLSRGVPEWDGGSAGPTYTTYNTDDMCRIGNVIYVSKIDANNNQNPATNTNAWQTLSSTFTGPNFCKAFVNFDGSQGVGNCPINGALGVDSVAKLNTGQYVVHFTSGAIPNPTYAVTGSAGSQDGSSPLAGDNNLICFGLVGYTPIKTTSQLTVYCWEANVGTGGQLEDSGSISIIVFGP